MLDRITADPNQMGGIPCIRGLRIPVATIIGLLAEKMTNKEILEAYPDLEQEDINQALRFAAYMTKEKEIPIKAPSCSSLLIMQQSEPIIHFRFS